MRRDLGATTCALLLSCATGSRAPSLTPREQAQVYLSRNQPEPALALLEGLHRASPRDLDLARALTEAHVRAGRTDALLERLTRESADTPVAHYMLGLAHFARAATADGAARQELERAIALAPQEAELHYRLGLILLESEQYPAAVGPLRQALTLSPTRAALHLPLAKAYARTGEPAKALGELRALVEGSPSPSEVATARALMEELADPFEGFPASARAKLEEGLAWLEERDVPQQAIVAFESLLRDLPDLAVVHALLGLAYQRVDDGGRAIEEFRRAIELAPREGKNHLYLGQLYLARQHPQEARTAFERALALHPLLDDAYLALGDLALSRRDLDAAQEQFRVLSHLQPQSRVARGKLAAVLQLKQDWKGADRELKRVLESAPNDLEFTLRLGVLHTERYQAATTPSEKKAAATEAARWLEQVLAQQPQNALASRALQTVRAAQAR